MSTGAARALPSAWNTNSAGKHREELMVQKVNIGTTDERPRE